MQRIPSVDAAAAPEKTRALLAAVTKQMGGVPHIIAAMAQSPAALEGYLGLAGGLSKGSFPAALREQIALAVAGANGCDYCASAHTALGKRAGLTDEETHRNLAGQSADPKVATLLSLAREIVRERGLVGNDDIAAFRSAGYDDAALVELIAQVSLNIFTNYLNHVAATEIDFPHVNSNVVRAA